MSSDFQAFAELIAQTKYSAVHLEMRDVYAPNGPVFVDWQNGIPIESDRHGDWIELVRDAIRRGIDWRCARIVSEPVTDYIQYEWETTTIVNAAAGEKVRWLPRQRASQLLLPGNDFWVFDDSLLRWTNYHGDGSWGLHEFSEDRALIRQCREAFEAVWKLAIDHADYTPRRKALAAV